jgi:hypothetical protein
MAFIQFFDLGITGEDLTTLIAKEPIKRIAPIAEKYFRSMLDRKLTAETSYGSVEYEVFRILDTGIEIVVKKLLVDGNAVTNLKNWKTVIQIIIDDHLIQMGLQYFNVYVLPTRRTFYYRKSIGVFSITKPL